MDITFILKDCRSYPNGRRRWTYAIKTSAPVTVENIEKAFEAHTANWYGGFDGKVVVYPTDDGKYVLEWTYIIAPQCG